LNFDAYLPHNSTQLDQYLVSLTLVFFVISECVHRIRDKMVSSYEVPHNLFLRELFDGLVFANSVMLLLSVYEPGILSLLGNTRAYVFIAAFGGFYFVGRGLWPPARMAGNGS